MGINITNNLGNASLTSVAKQVVPNIPVNTPAYSSTGWTAGDFLYQSATGVNPPPSGITGVGGPLLTLQATNLTVTGGLFNATQNLTSLFRTTAVYTGPNTSVENQFFEVQFPTTSSSEVNYCITLTNGNIVVVYHDAGNATPGYYYTIYSSIGAVVLAPTFIANAGTSTTKLVAAVAESGGGFRVFYWTNSPSALLISNEYTASGTFVNTVANSAGTPRDGICVRTIELVGGNVVIAYRNNSNGLTITGFNSTNTGVLPNQTLNGGPNSIAGHSFALYPLPSTVTSGAANGCSLVWYSNSSNASFFFTFNSALNGISGTTNTVNAWWDAMDIILLQDGTYVGIYGSSASSGSLNVIKVTINNSTGGPVWSGGGGSFASYDQQFPVKLIPMAGSGFAGVFSQSQNLYYRRTTGTTSAISPLTSLAYMGTLTGNAMFCAACGTNGFVYSSYAASAGVTIFTGFATASLTNGTTYTATNLTPPNYTFFGIAETTVSAGQTGDVIVSGAATANNSMPNITGTQYFDTTQTAMFGNKGFVTGRNFTLKGFE